MTDIIKTIIKLFSPSEGKDGRPTTPLDSIIFTISFLVILVVIFMWGWVKALVGLEINKTLEQNPFAIADILAVGIWTVVGIVVYLITILKTPEYTFVKKLVFLFLGFVFSFAMLLTSSILLSLLK